VNARRAVPYGRSIGAVVLAGGVTACGLMPMTSAGTTGMLTPPAPRSSVLVIILDPGSPADMNITSTLLDQSVRAGEHVMVLSDRGGAVFGSSTAPAQPSQRAPEPPAPLPGHPTSFQKARYRKAVHSYQEQLRRAWLSLQNRQRAALDSWARNVAAQVDSRASQPHAGTPDVSAALSEAAADLSSLRQSGVGSAIHEAIAIIGVSSTLAPSVPANLHGSTVVVDDFPGTGDEEAAWQAALDQAGASRTVVLTPATGNQLGATVRQSLDGAVTDVLTSVLFGLGQYTLEPAALPQLRRLLYLLTVTYPDATASIDGYTDNLPASGGNVELSQHRAEEIFSWLLANKVSASRLEAVGYGDTDPVAPDTSHGQPLNRRVVVIIDPATTG
jgi:outer membrane protein OmpA-like peptidoglycan-associated protein